MSFLTNKENEMKNKYVSNTLFITKSADGMPRTFQTQYEIQYLMDFKTQNFIFSH